MSDRQPPGPESDRFGWSAAAEMRRDLMAFCSRLQGEFGDAVRFHLGPHPCYQFTRPDQVYEVLVTKSRCFHKPARLKTVFGRFEGRGLVVSDGPLWQRQRQRVLPAFQPAAITGYTREIQRCIDETLGGWQSGTTVDFAAEMRHLTLRIVARVLFSADIDDRLDDVEQAVDVIQGWSMRELKRLVAMPLWMPLFGQPDARRAIATIRRVVSEIAEQRKNTDLSDSNGRAAGRDLLAVLLDDSDGPPMSDRQLRDELVTMLLAGHETMAAGLTWSAWLLAQYPQVQQKLRAGLDHGGGFTPLVERVFQESLRLYPPVYFLSREAVEPVQIGGFDIPRGGQVYLVPFLTHRDERWFSEPLEFRPERFEPNREADWPQAAWFPFGAGSRACVGRQLAMLEGCLILAAICRRFRLELPHNAVEPTLQWQLSLHPAGGMPIVIK